jgi:hypothetical protein
MSTPFHTKSAVACAGKESVPREEEYFDKSNAKSLQQIVSTVFRIPQAFTLSFLCKFRPTCSSISQVWLLLGFIKLSGCFAAI